MKACNNTSSPTLATSPSISTLHNILCSTVGKLQLSSVELVGYIVGSCVGFTFGVSGVSVVFGGVGWLMLPVVARKEGIGVGRIEGLFVGIGVGWSVGSCVI